MAIELSWLRINLLKKESNLCLSVDVTTAFELLAIADKVSIDRVREEMKEELMAKREAIEVQKQEIAKMSNEILKLKNIDTFGFLVKWVRYLEIKHEFYFGSRII